jgi:hypothetical protein
MSGFRFAGQIHPEESRSFALQGQNMYSSFVLNLFDIIHAVQKYKIDSSAPVTLLPMSRIKYTN